MTKKLVSLLMALMLVLACPLGALAGEAQPTEVIDALGRALTISAVPEKIISLAPSNTEILFALGVGDKVIGVDSYSDYPAEAAAIENKVGDYSGPNVELIISLEPDLVFADSTLQQEVIDQLTGLGITVVAATASRYDEVPAAIQLVADCVGADAAPVLAQMEAEKAEALAMTEGGAQKSAYFAMSFGEYGDWTSGKSTFVDDMFTMLGVTNVGADLGEASMVEAFKADANYAQLSAVKSGAVYAVDPNMSQRPGPRISQALKEFAGIIFPADAAQAA
jgi:iron complex transport system substrate-binding protein